MLGDGGEHVHREPVYAGHVGGDEVHAPFHQVGDEGDAAGEPVELGDQQRRAPLPAQGERCGEAGAVGLAPALDVLERGNDLGPYGPGVQLDCGTLRIQPEPGQALLVGGDAVVGDEGARDGCNKTIFLGWTVVPTLAPLPRPVQTLQTDVCIVRSRRKGEVDDMIFACARLQNRAG